MQNWDPRFAQLLGGFDFHELESHDGTVFGLWPDGTLAGFNRAWIRFAERRESNESQNRSAS